MRELHLFAGCGGGILGGMLLGHTTVCAVEISEYRRKVLLQRQRDGILPRFPIWDDVTTFDGKPWRGRVDVVAGGFPCQDISCVGTGAGIAGAKSSLWKEMARIIGEVGPRFVFVENSPMLVSRGLGQVLGDLAAMGYDAEWGVFSACSLGGPHSRERMFILGYASSERRDDEIHNDASELFKREKKSCRSWETFRPVSSDGFRDSLWCFPNTDAIGGFDGVADWMDRLSAAGDGQVPAVVAFAWRTLLSRFSSCDSKDQ